MADLGERIAILEEKVDKVEEGVSNFRAFQKDARDFFSYQRGATEEREKSEKKRDSRLNVILVIIGLILAYLTLRVEMKKQISDLIPISMNHPTFNADTLWPRR